MNTLWRVVDFLIVPLAIVGLAYEPNFAHGFLNQNESGQHLLAMRELNRGAVLFRDLFAQYGPLHYQVPALLGSLFGETVATLRGYFLIGEIAGFLAAWALCRVLIPGRGFAMLAVFVLVMEAHHPFWSTRWGGFRFAFVYLSVLGLVLALMRRKPAWLLLAGTSAAVAFLHTYDAGAAAGFAGLAYFVYAVATRDEGRALGREFARYAIGVAAVLLPFFFQLLVQGSLGDYLAQLPLPNPGRAFVQPIRASLITPGVIAPGIVYLAALGFGVWGLRTDRLDRERAAGLLVAICAGGLLYGAAFRALRGPQFEMSLPLAVIALFVMLAHAYDTFERGLDVGGDRVKGALAFGLICVVMVALVFGEIRAYEGGMVRFLEHQRWKHERVARHVGWNPLAGRYRTLEVPGGGRARLPNEQAREIEAVTQYLQRETRADEALLTYPDLGGFHFFAQRPLASRFPIAVLAAADPEWTQALLETVRERRAPVILVGRQLGTLARATGRREEYVPQFRAQVEENYDLVQRFEPLDVYRARASAVR